MLKHKREIQGLAVHEMLYSPFACVLYTVQPAYGIFFQFNSFFPGRELTDKTTGLLINHVTISYGDNENANQGHSKK